MKCEQLRDELLDLASARATASAEAQAHLDACENCARELASLRQTMNLLDEWQVPEPSPYFDQRLKARVREESAKAAPGWLEWLRKPALAAVFAGLLVAAVFLFREGAPPEQLVQTQPPPAVVAAGVSAQPGTAVSDLQDLDRNQDLYANFDWLDEMESQDMQPAEN
jgi:anti-sigma factor RsiW